MSEGVYCPRCLGAVHSGGCVAVVNKNLEDALDHQTNEWLGKQFEEEARDNRIKMKRMEKWLAELREDCKGASDEDINASMLCQDLMESIDVLLKGNP